MSHRILVTGSRDWPFEDRLKIITAISAIHAGYRQITIVHGDCPTGADLFARQYAERTILTHSRSGVAEVRHEAYPAYWIELGKSAGPIRNKYMVDLGADVCLAFPLPSSRGTISCMKLAQAAGIPVVNLGTLSKGEEFP